MARKLHPLIAPLFKDLFIEPNPVPIKTALGLARTDVTGRAAAALRDERSEQGAIAQDTRQIEQLNRHGFCLLAATAGWEKRSAS